LRLRHRRLLSFVLSAMSRVLNRLCQQDLAGVAEVRAGIGEDTVASYYGQGYKNENY